MYLAFSIFGCLPALWQLHFRGWAFKRGVGRGLKLDLPILSNWINLILGVVTHSLRSCRIFQLQFRIQFRFLHMEGGHNQVLTAKGTIRMCWRPQPRV